MGSTKRVKPRHLAEKLKKVRIGLGLTLEMLGEKLSSKEVTIYRGTVHNYETGDREPSLTVLLQYSKLANVYLEVLVDDEIELPTAIPSLKKSEGISGKRK